MDAQKLDPKRTLRHDIRGRLNALILCTTALQDQMPADEQLEFINHIEETAATMIELLDAFEGIKS